MKKAIANNTIVKHPLEAVSIVLSPFFLTRNPTKIDATNRPIKNSIK